MRKIFTILVTALLAIQAIGQVQQPKGRITGSITDGNAKTISAATITLLKASDSTVAKMGVADKSGKYDFENVLEGKYIVAVSAIGHSKVYSDVIEISAATPTVSVKEMELVPEAKAISGVTVTSKKPLIEQKAGKTVINVEASQTNTGLNALELLEKSPGVTVDNDGNISVKGKQGVTILVDGKPTYLSGADLAAMLKNMQSSQLEQIEVMTNPPAKYDAAGNSGIINIKTKKGTVKGMNGSANANYTQGLYARYNAGVNLNYRNDKLNIFGGYNGGRYEGYNNLTIDRNVYKDGALKNIVDQKSRPHFEGFYQNIKAGVDYNFSKRDVAGVVVNAGFNKTDEDPFSKTNVRLPDGTLDSRFWSTSDNVRRNVNLTANFNYKHTFDSTGRELTADLDYAYYTNRSRTSLLTSPRDINDIKTGDDALLKGVIPSYINIYSGKVDYVHPFRSGLKLEAGAKFSYVTTDNRVDYYRVVGSDWLADGRTNHFVYDENINAAYGILSRTFKKWELNAGLRLENTNAKGHQHSNDSSFTRNYTNLFPNLGVSYNMNEKNTFNFSYSRRIMRPDYDDLNPFIFFLDSLTFGQGNPYLQPQFTHNFELGHTWNRFLTTTVNYTETNDIITELLKQNSDKNETYQTRENFASMKQWGIAVMANFPITKWWSVNLYTNVFNNHYKGVYQQDPIEVKFTSLGANGTSTFTFGKGWSGEISGWYRSKVAEGLLVANSMGALNAGLAKQVLKKKGTIKIGVRDILYTQQFSGYAKYSDVDTKIHSKRDSRQFNASFTFRFGKTNIKPERRRTGGASDEQNRVKSGGN